MYESGILTFLAFALLFIKLPRVMKLKLIYHSFWLDLIVTAGTFAMLYGTFSGLMASAVAGLLTSIFTTIYRNIFGFIRGNLYHPGYINLSAALRHSD